MTYAVTNPPKLIGQGIGGTAGTKVWVYVTTDAAGTCDAADYISNGVDLGMTLNDNVIIVDTATPLTTWHRVETINAATVNLAQGTTIGSATSGD